MKKNNEHCLYCYWFTAGLFSAFSALNIMEYLKFKLLMMQNSMLNELINDSENFIRIHDNFFDVIDPVLFILMELVMACCCACIIKIRKKEKRTFNIVKCSVETIIFAGLSYLTFRKTAKIWLITSMPIKMWEWMKEAYSCYGDILDFLYIGVMLFLLCFIIDIIIKALYLNQTHVDKNSIGINSSYKAKGIVASFSMAIIWMYLNYNNNSRNQIIIALVLLLVGNLFSVNTQFLNDPPYSLKDYFKYDLFLKNGWEWFLCLSFSVGYYVSIETGCSLIVKLLVVGVCCAIWWMVIGMSERKGWFSGTPQEILEDARVDRNIVASEENNDCVADSKSEEVLLAVATVMFIGYVLSLLKTKEN